MNVTTNALTLFKQVYENCNVVYLGDFVGSGLLHIGYNKPERLTFYTVVQG